MPILKSYGEIEALYTAVATLFVQICHDAISAKGKVSIALSGGSTPEGLHRLLASEEYASQIKWDRVFIFWGDERCVPADSDKNNSYAARQQLLKHVPIPTENIFPVPTFLPPAKAAEEYEKAIIKHFGDSAPAFDLLLLGMGSDGHTASLFPGTSILAETKRFVSEVYVEKLQMDRVSFTLPLIEQARQIVFIVTGEGKASMVEKVLDPKEDTEEVPAMLIHDREYNPVLWFTDVAAVSKLHV